MTANRRRVARTPARERVARVQTRKSTTRKSTAKASPAESARRYQTVALVLQGGGALGAYQCGVYEALHGAGIQPNWFAGTSIGAINAAILAGNAPERRIERLREFWNTICEPAGTLEWPFAMRARDALGWLPPNGVLSAWMGALAAFGALVQGQRGFFTPRPLLAARTDSRQRGGDEFLRHRAAQDDARTACRFRSHQQRSACASRSARPTCTPATSAISIRRTSASDPNTSWRRARCRRRFLRSSSTARTTGTAASFRIRRSKCCSNRTPRRDTLVFQVDLWSARGIVPKTLPRCAGTAKGHPVFEPHAPRHRCRHRATASAQCVGDSARTHSTQAPAAGKRREPRTLALRSGLQHHPLDLSRQAVRRAIQGLCFRSFGDAASTGKAASTT